MDTLPMKTTSLDAFENFFFRKDTSIEQNQNKRHPSKKEEILRRTPLKEYRGSTCFHIVFGFQSPFTKAVKLWNIIFRIIKHIRARQLYPVHTQSFQKLSVPPVHKFGLHCQTWR